MDPSHPQDLPPVPGQAVLYCDAAGRIIEATPSACDLTGFTDEELRTRSLGDLGSSVAATDAIQLLGKLQARSAVTMDLELRRKDGRHRPVRMRVSRDASSGSERAVVRMGYRRRASEWLAENEQFINAILQTTPCCLMVIDRDDKVVFLNEAGEELIGRSFRDVRGRPLHDLLPLPEATGSESSWKAPDGRTRSVNWSIAPLELGPESRGFKLFTGSDVSALRDLERRRAQEKALVACCGDALLSKTPDGIVTSWNPAAEILYGYSAGEMIGRPVAVLVPPERQSEPPELIARVQRGESVRDFETVRIRKDGVRVPVTLTLAAIKDASGQLSEIVVVSRDVSQEHRVRQALENSERHLRHLLEEIPVALWTTDENLVISYCAGRLFGTGPVRPAAYFLGRRVEKTFPPDHAAIHVHREALGGRPGRYSIELEGHIYDAHVEPRTDPDNRIVGAVGAAIEVTDLRRAEQDLRESERRLHRAETIGRAGSWEWDFTTQKGSWSHGLFRLLGIDATASNASLASLLDLVHAGDRVRIHQIIRQAVAEGVPFSADFRLVRPDGRELTIFARTDVVRDESGRTVRIMGTFQDITERKRREEEIGAMNVRLEEGVRRRTGELEGALREMEAFTYAVAHDLRAPLRALHGLSDLLRQDFVDVPLGSQGREYLERIAQAARRMDNLIQDLLSYAQLRREDIPKEALDLRRVANGVIGLMTHDIDARRAKVIVEEGSEKVKANPVLLGQAIMNLVSNAIKFVAPGVTPVVHIRTQRIAQRARLMVEDNGIGIAPEHLDRIFGVFQRLNRLEDYPGTGIGLALVRRAVERMGGSVGVESVLGKGSTFWIEFPLDLGTAEES